MDNDRQFKRFIGGVASLRLTDEEKAVMRAKISAYALLMPIRVERAGAKRRWFFAVPTSSVTKRTAAVFSLVVTFAFSLAGVSYAADGALPGDKLYPFKISVNEGVRTAFAVTPESRAEWESSRATRRLQEVEALFAASRASASPDIPVQAIADVFAAHARDVEARVADFEARDNVDAAVDLSAHFETTLGAHEQILVMLASASADGDRAGVDAMAQAVERQRISAGEQRAKFEDVLRARPDHFKQAAEAKMRSSERRLDAALQTFGKTRKRIPEGVASAAELRIAQATELYSRGRTAFLAARFDEAFALFETAQRIAAESKVFLEAQHRFPLKIRFDGDEDVPAVTITPPTVDAGAAAVVGIGL